jgi:Cu(I)/Ag(I) efflux system membrane fusion protein
MNAKLTLKAYPNRVFEGVVAFIDPVLDPRTRTVKVRLEFPNESGELKPEMFGEVVLEGPSREGLRIPEDAVIHSGTKNVVFIALGAGKFAPRAVEVGTSDGSSVEVVNGLSEGEKVVVRANFLVDSESRLRASLASLTDSTGDRAPAKVPSKSIAPKEKHEAHSMSAPPSAAPEKQTGPMFACPMHPEVTDTKRSRCPKCGMYLEPVERK